MNNIALVYNSGHIEWYGSVAPLRGVRHEGSRPIMAYVDENVKEEYVKVNIEPALHPNGEGVYKMYEPLDKYIERNGKLVRLEQNQITKELVYKSCGIEVVYNSMLDSKLLDKEEAKDKYPEEFI